MAETAKPITDDDEEKELLEQHGHPNAVAPEQPEATDEVKEVPASEKEAPEVPAEAVGGDPDPAAAGSGAEDVPEAVTPKAEPTADAFTAAKSVIDGKIADLRAKKKAGELDFDDANDQINDLVMKRQDLVDDHVTQQNFITQFWNNFPDEHGISAKVGKELWKQAQDNMKAKGRLKQEAVETEFEHLLERAKTAKPKATKQAVEPPTSAPLPKGNTKIAPAPTASDTIPAKTEKTDEDELLDTVRKIPGGLRG